MSKEFYIPFDLENLMDGVLYTSVAHVVRVLILKPITGAGSRQNMKHSSGLMSDEHNTI